MTFSIFKQNYLRSDLLDPLLSPIDIKLSNPYTKHMVHNFFQYFIASQLPVTNILFEPKGTIPNF